MNSTKVKDIGKYLVKFENGNINSKIIDIKKYTYKSGNPDYCLVLGQTIKHWDEMNEIERKISIGIDALLIGSSILPENEINKIIKNITDLVDGK